MTEHLTHILNEKPFRLILSRPRRKTGISKKKAILRRGDGYVFEDQENPPITETSLAAYLSVALADEYRQLDAWTENRNFTLMVSQKGKAALVSRRQENQPPVTTHDRKKQYILPEGVAVPPLVDLGVITPEGRVLNAMQHKYRQINRFLEMIDDVLPEITGESLTIVDYGCGKSYLTFLIYYYLTAIKGFTHVHMTGLDIKTHVIDECNAAAQKYGYSGLHFVQGDITTHRCAKADMVIALHACDTATDHALFHAVRGGARVILAAPCCQHELNTQMQSDVWPILTRYGVVRERTAALMTDAIRANLLAYCGYRTQLMEFVELTHTPKNLLIRAVKTDIPPNVRTAYRAEVEALCRTFGFSPTLMRLLDEESESET